MSYAAGQSAPSCCTAAAKEERWTYQQLLLYLSRHAGGIDHHVGHAGITWGKPQHIPRAFGIQDAHHLCSARRLIEDGHYLCCGPYARKLCHAAVTRAPSCMGLTYPIISSDTSHIRNRATLISCFKLVRLRNTRAMISCLDQLLSLLKKSLVLQRAHTYNHDSWRY